MPKATSSATLAPFKLPPHRRGSSNRLGVQNAVNYKKNRKQSLVSLLSSVNANVNNIKGGLKIFQKRKDNCELAGSNIKTDLVPERTFNLGKLTRTLPRRDLHSLVSTLDKFECEDDVGEDDEEDECPPPCPEADDYVTTSSYLIETPGPGPLHSRMSYGEEAVFRTFFVPVEEIQQQQENESKKLTLNDSYSIHEIPPTLPRRKQKRLAGKAKLIRNNHPDLKQVPYGSLELERYKRMQISRLSRKLISQEMIRDGYNPASLLGANWENETNHQWKNPWVKISREKSCVHYWKNTKTGEELEEQMFDEDVDI